jgi:3-deoxy-manno-octulosonate cytidylyltransferase (CMP-KDO synthetase)
MSQANMPKVSYRIVIPARMNSTRLPGKMLLPLGSATIIEQVVARCSQAMANEVIVATDHNDIACLFDHSVVNAVMTNENHPSGTDRLAEVAHKLQWQDDDIVVNVQGDEPEIPVAVIEQLAEALSQSSAAIATLVTPVDSLAQVQDPNVVKVALADNGHALYFSRNAIPFDRDANLSGGADLAANDCSRSHQPLPYFRHIGIYAYRVKALKQFASWSVGKLESIEKLEQLRFLEKGESIQAVIAEQVPPVGIDTQADYEQAVKAFAKG